MYQMRSATEPTTSVDSCCRLRQRLQASGRLNYHFLAFFDHHRNRLSVACYFVQ